MNRLTTAIQTKQRTLRKEMIVSIACLVLISFHLLNTYRSGVEGKGIGLSLPMLLFMMIPGSLMYLVVMLIKKWMVLMLPQRICLIGLIAMMFAIGGVFIKMPGFLLCFPITDIGVRKRVVTCGGLTRLSSWAATMFETPYEVVTHLPRENLPEHIRCLHAPYVAIFNRPHEGNSRLDIIWGGGFHHWGIIIIPQHQQLERYPIGWVNQWQPGIYTWYEDQ